MKNLSELSDKELDQLINSKKKKANKFSTGQALGRGAVEGATLGFAPKISGALGSLYARSLRPELFEEPFAETYQQARDIERQKYEQARAEHPYASFAGNLLGGAALPFPATSFKQALGLGAGYGALGGLGTNDIGEVGSLGQQDLLSAAQGAGIGAATAGIASPIINKLFGKKVQIPPSEPIQENIRLSEKFNIPMTKAEFTRNPLEVAKEEAIRLGKKGEKSQSSLKEFKETQRQRFDEALNNVKKEISGNQEFISKGEHIGDVVKNLQDKALAERKAYSDLYKQATEGITKIDKDQIAEFPRLIVKDLEESALTNDNIPRTYNEIRSLNNIISSGHIDLKKLEAWKQGLNRSIREVPQGGQEEFGLKQLSDKFDGFLDGIIDKALIEGDSKTLQQFRDARGLAAEWFSKYKARNNDEFGRIFLEDIIDNARLSREPFTNEMLVNKIFGSSELGFKPQAASIVKELKKHISPEEFNSLKLEAGQKIITPLLKDNPNVQTYINNLAKFKNNASLANELFSKNELQQLSEIGDIANKIFTRERSIANPSGTAFINDILKRTKKFDFLLNLKNNFEGNQDKIIKGLSQTKKQPANVPINIIPALINQQDRKNNIQNLSDDELDQLIMKMQK